MKAHVSKTPARSNHHADVPPDFGARAFFAAASCASSDSVVGVLPAPTPLPPPPAPELRTHGTVVVVVVGLGFVVVVVALGFVVDVVDFGFVVVVVDVDVADLQPLPPAIPDLAPPLVAPLRDVPSGFVAPGPFPFGLLGLLGF